MSPRLLPGLFHSLKTAEDWWMPLPTCAGNPGTAALGGVSGHRALPGPGGEVGWELGLTGGLRESVGLLRAGAG